RLTAGLQPLGKPGLRVTDLADEGGPLAQTEESGRHPAGVAQRAKPLQALLPEGLRFVHVALVEREPGDPQQRLRPFRRGGGGRAAAGRAADRDGLRKSGRAPPRTATALLRAATPLRTR